MWRIGKKQYLYFLVLLILLLPLPGLTVRADIGPKPSVRITFIGLEEQDYYVTLLSETTSTGPYSEGDFSSGYEIGKHFADYQDADGFHYLGYHQECVKGSPQQFAWTYYPPASFKILLYFPQEDRFLVSEEVYERYAFDSYYTVERKEREPSAAEGRAVITGGEVRRSYDYTWELLSLFARIVITIAVELGIAWLFRLRSKGQILVIGVTNLVTQTVLNILLNISNYRSGSWKFVFHYIWMELLVFVIEGIVYSRLLGDGRKGASERAADNTEESGTISRRVHPWLYAFAANAASFAAGMWIAGLIPGIF